MKRRTFLQQAGLVGFGASQIAMSCLSDRAEAVPLLDRYFQALAQPTGRKLALLVGINQYRPSEMRLLGALQGCVTDVELQKELLIHRFGFQESDVLTLTDIQATRENIETAFLSHLTEQTKPGDVVVFHFSGYGSQVITADGLSQNSLVPVDAVISNNDLLEDTLLLLLRSLKTARVTTVLDTSYTGITDVRRGSLRIRSCPPLPSLPPSDDASQEQLLSRLGFSGEHLKQFRREQIPGLLLTASRPLQPATEAQWGGFSAGLFTYALTQNLWQTTPTTTIQVNLSRTAGMVGQVGGRLQQPTLRGHQDQRTLAYYLPPDPGIGADGVVTAVEESGKTAHIWLAGLPAIVLQHYSPNSLLTLNDVELQMRSPTALACQSRDGLTARAKIVSMGDIPIQPGQLVREKSRVLPRHLGLIIALDPGLQRIERVDATSAFANIDAVSSVVTAVDQAVDYLFGKVPASETQENSEKTPPGTSYALFSSSGELIPNTGGEPGEAVKPAINRLVPKLKTLLAAKLLRLTANEGSSRLDIEATLEVAPSEIVMQRQTLRANLGEAAGKLRKVPGGVPTLSIGSRIQYRIQNHSSRPIYIVLLGLDSGGNALALYAVPSLPTETDVAKPVLKDSAIAPGETLIIPQPASEWLISGLPGLAEIQLISSIAPFTNTLAALGAARQFKGEGDQISDLLNSLEVAKAVLQDLHQASALETLTLPDSNTTSDTYILDVNAWATLSFIYQVI